MTYHDDVLAIMRMDPGRDYTAREIALVLFPADRGRERMRSRTSTVVRVLRTAERYGFVKGHAKGPRAYVWRLTE